MAKVTLCGTPSLVEGSQWPHFTFGLAECLPLRSLHWKSSSRPSIRTIQELDVTLSPYKDSHSDAGPHLTIFDNSLLSIYVASCDDGDTYKNSVKKHIQEWRSVISSNAYHEWLVILIVPSEAGSKKRFHMKGSILDKIRADFNTDKRDRCAQLQWSGVLKDPTIWADVVSKMKESVIACIDSYVSAREEELRRLESLHQVPDWDFAAFFECKNNLATSFESLGLCEDAQMQLDELEATYFQIITETGSSPINVYGGAMPRDDSCSLLLPEKKPYRDGRITFFDFRTYLFNRQWHVSVKRHEYLSAIQKAATFISSFSRSLLEAEGSLGFLFAASWTYSSCLNVIDSVQYWGNPTLDPVSATKINWCKARLHDLARTQLERIGVAFGHLPDSWCRNGPIPAQRVGRYAITHKDLVAAVGDRHTFDKLYVMITNKAIEQYTAGGGRRSALKLHASLALFDSVRQRPDEALPTLQSLPAHYLGSQWTLLRGHMLLNQLEVHSMSGKSQDDEWSRSAIELLACMALVGHDHDASDILIASNSPNTGAALVNFDPYNEGVVIDDHPMFRPEWATLSVMETGSGMYPSSLTIIVHCLLRQSTRVQGVSAIMTRGASNGAVRYTAGAMKIAYGPNPIVLKAPSPQPGLYCNLQLDISFNEFLFRYHVQNTQPSKRQLVRITHSEEPNLDEGIAAPLSTEDAFNVHDIGSVVETLPARELALSRDTAKVKIVNIVTLDFPQTAHIQPGQPARCVVRIFSTFECPHSRVHQDSCTMRYTVGVINLNSWLISGPSRGEYQAQHGTIHDVKLTLIALHHGELALPSVSVEPQAYTCCDVNMPALVSETHLKYGARRMYISPRMAGTTFTLLMPKHCSQDRLSLDT